MSFIFGINFIFIEWLNKTHFQRLKWIGVSAIIRSIASFILIYFINYFSNAIMKLDSSTISPYTIPIVIGNAGCVF